MGIWDTLSIDLVKRLFPRLYESFHVNLLQGHINLTNLDIPSSDVFTLSSFLPLYVASGSIASFTLHIPWTTFATSSSPAQLSAQDVHLILKQPESHQSQQQASVFDAFMRDVLHSKQVAIETRDQQQQHSNIDTNSLNENRLLQLLLPRVELDIRNINIQIHFANNAVVKLSLASLTTSPTIPVLTSTSTNSTTTTDLFKSFFISSLTIDLSLPPCRSTTRTSQIPNLRPVVLSIPETQLSVTFPAHQTHDISIDFNFPSPTSGTRDNSFTCHVPSLLRLVVHISNTSNHWRNAFLYKRPAHSVAQNPISWFQYAVRAVLKQQHHTNVITSLRNCVRYSHLYERRLRNQSTVDDKRELDKLEFELHVDVLLTIRAHVATKVLASDLSSSVTSKSTSISTAATSWFSFPLFSFSSSTTVSTERENLERELLNALAALNVHRDSLPDSPILSNNLRVRFTCHINRFSTCLTGLTTAPLQFCLNRLSVHANMDSNMCAYDARMDLKDMTLCLGDCAVFYASSFNDIEDASLFSLTVQKRSSSETTSVAFRTLPLSLVLPVRTLRQCITCARDVFTSFRTSIKENPSAPSFLSSTSIQNDVVQHCNIEYTTDISSLDVIFCDSLPQHVSQHAIVLRCSRFNFHQDFSQRVRSSASFKVISCMIRPIRLAYDYGNDEDNVQKFSISDREKNAFLIKADVTAHVEQNKAISAVFDNFKTKCNLSELAPFLALSNSVRNLADDISTLQQEQQPSSISISNERDQHDNTAFTIDVDVPSIHIDLTHHQSSAQHGGSLVVSGLHLSYAGVTRCTTLSFDLASVTELQHGGKLSIETSDRQQQQQQSALTLNFIASDSKYYGSSPVLHANVQDVRLSTSIQSFVNIVKLVDIITDTMTSVNTQSNDDSGTQSSMPCKTKIDIQTIGVCLEVPHSMSTNLRHVSIMTQHPSILDIHCEDMSISDDTINPSNCKHFFRKLSHSIESRVLSADRALIVSIAPDHVNLHLSDFELTLTHSLKRRIESVVDSFSSVFNESPQSSSQQNNNNDNHNSNGKRVMVRGSNLSVALLAEQNAVRLDIPQATAVFSVNSQIISIRKVSVLTRTSILNSSLPQQPHSQHQSPLWRVLLRNFDADVSHYYACALRRQSTHIIQHSFNYKDSWSATILSRVVIYLAPSQVRCLTNIISPFLDVQQSEKQSQATHPNEKPSNVILTPTEVRQSMDQDSHNHPPSSSSASKSNSGDFDSYSSSTLCTSDVSLSCETHAMSIELFNEDDTGHVSSTVAAIELDPVLFSLKTVTEFSMPRHIITRKVTTWRATCTSFRLEDRNVRTAHTRQVVVETEDSWIGLHGTSSSHLLHHDNDTLHIGLSVDGIVKVVDGHSTSSHQVQLKRARVLLSSQLHATLVEFFNRCVVNRNKHNNDLDNHPATNSQSDVNDNSNVDSHSVPDGTLAPVSKLSLLLIDPVVVLFSTASELGDSAFQIRADSINGSLLFSRGGKLLPGSVIRIRRARLFLLWMPDDEADQDETDIGPDRDSISSSPPESPNGLFNIDEVIDADVRRERKLMESSLLSKEHCPRPRRRNGKKPMLKDDDDSSASPSLHDTGVQAEPVLDVQLATVRLPVGDERHFAIVVPDVLLNSSLSTLKNAITIAATLDLGVPDDRSAPVLCPELRISIGDLSACVKVPVRVEEVGDSTFCLRYVSLALKLACDLTVAKNVEQIVGEVKISSDVKDEALENVSDQFISPTRIQFKLNVIERIFLDFWSEHFIRLTLSPLITRTLAGIAHSFGMPDNNDHNNSIINNSNRNIDQNSYENKSGMDDGTVVTASISSSEQNEKMPIGIRVAVRGIIFYCVAQNPRVQLLRLVLHDLMVGAIIPCLTQSEGMLEVSLEDLEVEDTVSWTIPRRNQESSNLSQWTKLVCGNHLGLSQSRNTPFLNTLQRMADAVQGISRQISAIRSRSVGRGNSRKDTDNDTNQQSGSASAPSASSPLVSCAVKWVTPWEHVTAHIGIKGLDFNIDLGLLLSIIEWVKSITQELEETETSLSSLSSRCYPSSVGHTTTSPTSADYINDNRMDVDDALNIRIDHVVVEEIVIRVCLRAPPPPLEEGFIARLLGLLFLNEEEILEGIELVLPRVVFNGDFFSVDRVFERIEALYISAITSRHFARQVALQLPRVVRMTRVLGTTLLRQRRTNIIVTRVESAALNAHRRREEVPGVGLLALLPSNSDDNNNDEQQRNGNMQRLRITGNSGTFHRMALVTRESGKVESHESSGLSGVQVIDITGAPS